MSVLAQEAAWPRETVDRDYSARASVSPEVFEAEMRNYRSRSEEMRAHATHLDVVYDVESGQTIDIYGAGSEPVSYTHLDVYKRQSPSCASS